MSIKQYVYEVTESRQVSFSRTCSNCSYGWTASIRISAEGSASSLVYSDPDGRAEARKSALKELDRIASLTEDIDEKILCPKCGFFCTKAMNKHFPKGFAIGLLKKYQRQQSSYLFKGFAWAFGALAILGGTIVASFLVIVLEEELFLFVPIIFFVVLGVIAGGVSAKKFNKYIQSSNCSREVAEMVGSRSDGELLKLTVKCYQANNKSLGTGEAWTDVLRREIPERQEGN